ncbi:unnamed protein product [Schistosoma margrebowiei]|uniref:Ras-like protein family member 10B n=1 Tax=Schistosoma margrebowiei TaxID=48269 RepID=A0AA84ZWG7_9TREM|nr:unnamed protein product [Schistosoma margrebowiei]
MKMPKKHKRIRIFGSAARLAGWEQISTSEEDLEEGKNKKNNEFHPKQKFSIIHNTKSNIDIIEETTPIILHKCKSINKAKINNTNEINIQSLINQNELLRQEDDVNVLESVNKKGINEKKSIRSTCIHDHHVKFSHSHIKFFPSFITSSSTTSPTVSSSSSSVSSKTLKSIITSKKSSSSLNKLSECIPLKNIFDLQTYSSIPTLKSSINVPNTISCNINCNVIKTTNINNNTSNSTLIYEVKPSSSIEYSDHILRVPVLGSRQSGKTTLIKQFIHCIDPGNPLPTCKHPDYYDPMISFNDRIYYVRLIDCPPIDKKFPTNSIEEWENYRGWGLRNASAFILVFDVNSESSFQHIRQLRDQIVSEFNDIPLLLVANKIDLLQQCTNGFNSNNIIPSFYSTSSTSSSTITMPIQGQLQMVHLNNSNYRFNIRRDINMIIKKQWKRTILVECSAKYNWHVMNVFRELMRILENREQAHRPTAARAVQNALRNNQCLIM